MVPKEKTDVAQLRPVEVVWVMREGDQVILQTDTEDYGAGTNVMLALEALKLTSTGRIYLDTADFLLIGKGAEQDAEALRKVLKPGVLLCGVQDVQPTSEVSQYLRIHGELPKFSGWNSGSQLPLLAVENNRLKLLKKSEIKA